MTRAAKLAPLLAIVLAGGPALAQLVDPTTNQPTNKLALAKMDFQMTLQRLSGETWINMSDTEAKLFFNRAKCECQTPFRVRLDLTASGRTKLAGVKDTKARYKIRVGNQNCVSSDPKLYQVQCEDHPDYVQSRELASLVRNSAFIDFTVDMLFRLGKTTGDAGASDTSCSQDATQQVWVFIDLENDNMVDLAMGEAPVLGIELEGAGPEMPEGVTVKPGHEALEVSWTALESATNFDGYLVFCARGGTHQVFNPSYYKSQYYQTAVALCPERFGGTQMPLSLAQTAADADNGVQVPAPKPFHDLDPAFLCAERITSQTHVRIRTLENGVPYLVGVTAVDRNGNATPIEAAYLQKPIPTRDFYRGYRVDGGAAEGGFCAIARTPRRPGLFGVAFIAIAFALRARARARARARGRGRSRARVAARLGARARRGTSPRPTVNRDFRPKALLPLLLLLLPALLALAPRPAAAQAILHEERDYSSPQNFALELRLGPYRPDVDSEFAGTGRSPHNEFFGSQKRLLGQIELDYQFFHMFGSAGIGLSMGYFNESAHALVEPAPGQPATERSGDETELTLVPIALSFVYRFDVAALRWNIPLIPYGKAGVNYTLWSIYDGNDNIAKAASGSGRGRGGTAGWHVAAGVSFLLDIIDPGAARELDAEIGVNHTHVFFELTKIEASGLGQSGKLHVGDTTWCAGLMFEM